MTNQHDDEFDENRAERRREVDERRKEATQKMHQIMQIGQTLTGRVKHVAMNLNGEMAYGFVTPDDSSLDDLFMHHSEIEPWRDGFKEVKAGDVVKFKVSKGAGRNIDKWQAVSIEVDREATDKAPPFRNTRRSGGSGGAPQQPFHRGRRDDSDNFNR